MLHSVLSYILLLAAVIPHHSAAYKTIDDAGTSATMWLSVTSLFRVLVDVRTQDEWDMGHLPNATFIESLHVNGNTSLLAGCEECNIAVYCHSGRRAMNAAEVLDGAGFKHVYNVLGVEQWMEAGVELVNTPDRKPGCDKHCSLGYFEDES